MPKHAHLRFHQKTALLTFQFFRFAKIHPTTVNVRRFHELCTHLNPVAEIPTLAELAEVVRAPQPEAAPCILCGLVNNANQMVRLDTTVAAMYLTTSVLIETKTRKQAKSAMLEEKLVVCQSHISHNQLSDELLRVMDWSYERLDAYEEIPYLSLVPGMSIFNSITNMRNMYFDQDIVRVQAKEYRQIVTVWLMNRRPRAPTFQPIKNPKSNQRGKYHNLISEQEYEMMQQEQEAPAQDLPFLMGLLSQPQTAPILEEQEKEETPVGGSVEFSRLIPLNLPESEVKLEEPDYDEHATTASEPPQKPLIPKKPIIYTLKNGKKVVKAPFMAALMARKKMGKLVTHRIVTKRGVADGQSPDEAPLIKRVDYKPEGKFEERKPEFLEFGGESSTATSTLPPSPVPT